MLGAGVVTLSASYAIGDVTGTKHSLHRTWCDAPKFHGSYAALVVTAAAVVLIPLPAPVRSPARTIALVVLRGYLFLAAVAVLIRIVRLIAAT